MDGSRYLLQTVSVPASEGGGAEHLYTWMWPLGDPRSKIIENPDVSEHLYDEISLSAGLLSLYQR